MDFFTHKKEQATLFLLVNKGKGLLTKLIWNSQNYVF